MPDELLAWGKEWVSSAPGNRGRLPWAFEVEALVRKGQIEPSESRRFWARLEGLATAAVRHGQGELLLGLDTFSAQMIGLRIHIDADGRRWSLGSGTDWSFHQIEQIGRIADDGNLTGGMAAVAAACEFIGGAGPWTVERTADDLTCAQCGVVSMAMIQSGSGFEYCPRCWRWLIEPWPRVERRGTKVIVTWERSL